MKFTIELTPTFKSGTKPHKIRALAQNIHACLMQAGLKQFYSPFPIRELKLIVTGEGD